MSVVPAAWEAEVRGTLKNIFLIKIKIRIGEHQVI